MPRTREFEPELALDAAMRVFWAKGYSEASYEDLVAGTGVSRKGLYSAFGDKHSLFLAALKNYRSSVVPQLLAGLEEDQVTAQDIRSFFCSLAQMAVTEAGRQGCFMTRTSADDIMTQPEVRTIMDRHLDDLRQRLHRALTKADFGEERSARLAPYLVGVIQGLFTLAHARAGADVIDPFVEEAMASLG
ncbi:TetR/AcrR family transcriptional regulator [Roseobacteraceae bacterium S113]